MTKTLRAIVLGVVCFLVPTVAYADAGVPMLAVFWSASWFTFVPIVVIEAWVARRILGLMWNPALRRSTAANAASTLVGIPLTWAILVVAELVFAGDGSYGLETPQKKLFAVVAQAPWLIPYEGDLGWMVPAASLVLLVPFFFVSVYVERWIFDRKKELDRALVRSWSWKANLLTYGIMGLLLAAALMWALAEGHYTNSGPIL